MAVNNVIAGKQFLLNESGRRGGEGGGGGPGATGMTDTIHIIKLSYHR